MTEIAGRFFGHWGQAADIGAVALVWLSLAAIGAAVGGRGRETAADAVVGWALVAAAFTLGGVFLGVPFRWMGAATAVAGAAAAAVVWRHERRIATGVPLRLLVLAAPILLLASAMAASQWDEFSHWLPSTRFLLGHDGFPDADHALTGATYPAYPYDWPLLGYLVGRVAGRLVESAGPLINLLLLFSFAGVLAKLIAEGAGRKEDGESPGWGLAALAGLAVTLLNPTFAQKVAMTAYADTATTVAAGFAGVFGWRLLGALAAGDEPKARHLALLMGLALSLLVNLKQATLVLAVLVVAAVLAAGLRDPTIRLAALARALPAILVPPLVLYATWRWHVATELSGREFAVRPFSEWYLQHVPTILWKMLVVLAKKGLYLAVVVAALAAGLAALVRCRGAFDRLALIVAAVFLGYNAFLVFAYVAAFGENEALMIGSYWRYNMHLGLLVAAFAWYGLALLWRARAPAWLGNRRLYALPLALILAAPVALSGKLRFDREPHKPHYRAVAAELPGLLAPGSGTFVLDPAGTGESAMIAKYELDGASGRGYRGYLGAFHDSRAETVRTQLAAPGIDHVLVHSVVPGVTAAVGADLEPGISYLLERAATGRWRIVRRWPYPRGD